MTHYNFYYCHSQQQRFQWFTCMSHYPVQKRLCPTANRRVHRTASRIKTCLLLKLWALRPPGLSDLAAQWIGEIAKNSRFALFLTGCGKRGTVLEWGEACHCQSGGAHFDPGPNPFFCGIFIKSRHFLDFRVSCLKSEEVG